MRADASSFCAKESGACTCLYAAASGMSAYFCESCAGIADSGGKRRSASCTAQRTAFCVSDAFMG